MRRFWAAKASAGVGSTGPWLPSPPPSPPLPPAVSPPGVLHPRRPLLGVLTPPAADGVPGWGDPPEEAGGTATGGGNAGGAAVAGAAGGRVSATAATAAPTSPAPGTASLRGGALRPPWPCSPPPPRRGAACPASAPPLAAGRRPWPPSWPGVPAAAASARSLCTWAPVSAILTRSAASSSPRAATWPSARPGTTSTPSPRAAVGPPSRSTPTPAPLLPAVPPLPAPRPGGVCPPARPSASRAALSRAWAASTACVAARHARSAAAADCCAAARSACACGDEGRHKAGGPGGVRHAESAAQAAAQGRG